MVSLSNQGHWFGGQTGRAEVCWVTPLAVDDAVLSWELELGLVRLASGQVTLNRDQAATCIDVPVPSVRARTAMRWTYCVMDPGGTATLAVGFEEIHVYPENLLAGVGPRLAGRTLTICDGADGLPRTLTLAGIPHVRVERDATALNTLETLRGDIIVVGPNWLTESPFSQAAFLNQARSGCSVFLFAQTHVRQLAGYALLRRPPPGRLEWRLDHPLLAGFLTGDVEEWVRRPGEDVWAVQMPADEAAFEVVYWSPMTRGREPVPIDALMLVQRVGAGRIVLCQLPPMSWNEDPRAQVLLRNALDYLLTRPEPTPRPSERVTTRPVWLRREPEITVPSGGRP